MTPSDAQRQGHAFGDLSLTVSSGAPRGASAVRKPSCLRCLASCLFFGDWADGSLRQRWLAELEEIRFSPSCGVAEQEGERFYAISMLCEASLESAGLQFPSVRMADAWGNDLVEEWAVENQAVGELKFAGEGWLGQA